MATKKRGKSVPLTLDRIKKAKPQDYPLFDGGGLHLTLEKSGSRLWRMLSRLNGKQILLSFGKYPVVSLQEARRKRLEAQKKIAEGINPNEEKKAAIAAEKARSENTFEKIAVRMVDSKSVTDKHKQKILRGLQLHIFPHFGAMNIADIKPKELFETFKAVAMQPNLTNKVGSNKTYMAKRLCRWCAEVYDHWDMEQGFQFMNNPCRSMVKRLPTHKADNNRQIPLSEFGVFLAGLDEYKGFTRYAIYMMLYTGFRQISLRRAQWKDFDLEKAVWNRQPEKQDPHIHPIPLPKQAIKILEEIKPLTYRNDDSLVFQWNIRPTRDGLAFSERSIKNAIDEIAKRKNLSEMQAHGIRGLFSTALNERGYDERWIERQVGHAIENDVKASYNKADYMEKRREMLQAWADHIDAIRRRINIKLVA